MKTPKISVILPCYNAEEYLRESIDSILNQSFSDFELIIINDGSTDSTFQIISEYKDDRIILILNETNLGLIRTLNIGISKSRGELVARMDADDISRPERFQKQLEYLLKHPKVGVCGTWMHMIHNQTIYKQRYLLSDQIKSVLLFANPIVHPSVMFRKSIFENENEIYNSNYPHAEDYALWVSLIEKTEFAIIDEPLFEYRAHTNQVSRNFNEIQRASVKQAQQIILDKLQLDCTDEEKEIQFSLYIEEYQKTNNYYSSVEKWLSKLIVANQATKFFNENIFRNIVGEWWFRVNRELAPSGFGSYSRFKNSPLSAKYEPSATAIAKIRVKSILKARKKN